MDILTYVLAKNSGGSGGNGALTGLSGMSINEDRQLVFEFTNGTSVTSSSAIPAASEADILAALVNNTNAIKNTLNIPAALNESISAIQTDLNDLQNVYDGVLTTVLVSQGPGLNPVSLGQIENHTLTLPLASGTVIGLVKGVSDSASNEEKENMISINSDGTMSVYSLNVNKLVQSIGDELIIGDIG